MSSTLLNLAKIIARELGYVSGTATSGSTTALLDSSADSPFDQDDDSKLYQDAYLKIEADSAGTPLNVGSVRRIKKSGYTEASQQVAWNTALTDAVTSTQSYGIYFSVPPSDFGISKGISTYINEVLRNLQYRYPLLLTLVTDGDMETSGVTNWTQVNSTATKVTTASYVFGGKQCLRVVNSAANGYARSALIAVAEGQSYQLVADVIASTGTAKLQLYDETNSAEIDSVTTDELRKGYLWLDGTNSIPDGCEQVSIRLIGTGASDDIYWDNVSFRNQQADEMVLPSWFQNEDWLDYVFYTYGGNQEQDNDSRHSDERNEYRLSYQRVITDHGASNPYKVEFNHLFVPSAAHLWASCLRPYGELSADTDSTDADQDWVKAWVLAMIFTDLGKEFDAKKWLAIAGDKHRIWRPVQKAKSYAQIRGL